MIGKTLKKVMLYMLKKQKYVLLIFQIITQIMKNELFF